MRTRDGVEIHYETREGDEPALVLIHGWANNRTVWTHIAHTLSRRLIIPDLRGHGKSGKPGDEQSYSIERFTRDITELLDHEGVERCVLVGHSMGGMIALMTEDPRIEGLVLINTSAGIKERLPIGPSPFLSRIARFFEEHQNLIPSDLSETYRNDFNTFIRGLAGTSPMATIRCFEEMYELDASERLETIDTPTLIIVGRNDHILPERFSKALTTLRNSSLETIDSTHFSLLEDSDRIAAHIESFVERIHESRTER